MIRLERSRDAWGSPAFEATLAEELRQIPSALPLQQGLSATSHALDDKLAVMVMGSAEHGDFIRARVGLFYEGIVAGCSCADDPTPVESQSEYCEAWVAIHRTTGAATVTLAEEEDG